MAQWNLLFGWFWMLVGMMGGAMIGLSFHNEKWLGGYGSWRRRMVRLAHVAFFGTGLINIAFALSVRSLADEGEAGVLLNASAVSLLIGATTMPLVCYGSAWRVGVRHLFFIPVVCLIGAVAIFLAWGLMR